MVLTPRLPYPDRDLGLSISGPQFPRCIIVSMGDRAEPSGSDLFGLPQRVWGGETGSRPLASFLCFFSTQLLWKQPN